MYLFPISSTLPLSGFERLGSFLIALIIFLYFKYFFGGIFSELNILIERLHFTYGPDDLDIFENENIPFSEGFFSFFSVYKQSFSINSSIP